MFAVPFIPCGGPRDVEHVLDLLPREPIACRNWPETFPSAPDVGFAAFHDGATLHIRFCVEEPCTRALETLPGRKVCTDSCVEFFFRPGDGPYYYNFEFNAIGTLFLACRTGRHDPCPAPDEVLKSVRTFPSLGTEPFAERCGDNRWRLRAEIPVSALFRHSFADWGGLRGGMNLYKCGDALSRPHYLSWRPVRSGSPDFHRPECFADVIFE